MDDVRGDFLVSHSLEFDQHERTYIYYSSQNTTKRINDTHHL